MRRQYSDAVTAPETGTARNRVVRYVQTVRGVISIGIAFVACTRTPRAPRGSADQVENAEPEPDECSSPEMTREVAMPEWASSTIASAAIERRPDTKRLIALAAEVAVGATYCHLISFDSDRCYAIAVVSDQPGLRVSLAGLPSNTASSRSSQVVLGGGDRCLPFHGGGYDSMLVVTNTSGVAAVIGLEVHARPD